MYLNKMHSELLHRISIYLGYVDVHVSLKYLNKEIKVNVQNNKKIEMRKSNVYIYLMKQKIYFMHKMKHIEQHHDISVALQQYYLLKNNIVSTNKKQTEKLAKLNKEARAFAKLLKIHNCFNKPIYLV